MRVHDVLAAKDRELEALRAEVKTLRERLDLQNVEPAEPDGSADSSSSSLRNVEPAEPDGSADSSSSDSDSPPPRLCDSSSSDSDSPPPKRARTTTQRVWVLVKGDHPAQFERLVGVEVLGVYSSSAKAEEAKEEYLEEEGWEEGGYGGYHQGEMESRIDIIVALVDE